MKLKSYILLLLFFSTICLNVVSAQAKTIGTLLITNNGNTVHQNYLVSIPWKQMLSKYPSIDFKKFKIKSQFSKKEIPYQLEYLGEFQPQNILLLMDIIPGKNEKLSIINEEPSLQVNRTYCRYVPERKDDFAWENDKIAFRMYGKALEGTKENANGIDVWVKRTNRLILNERYKRGEYHIDHGDGMDYYHVGMTLGAGNIAPFLFDSIYFPNNYRKWAVLDNGPLRSTFQLSYDSWMVAGKPVTMTKTVSIDAGSQLSRISVCLSSSSLDTLPVVVGITLRKDPGVLYSQISTGILAYWEPTQIQNGTTGVGVIISEPLEKIDIVKDHLLAFFTIKTNQVFTYFSGAAWDKAQEIISAEDWKTYLATQVNKMKTIVDVKLL